MTTMSRKAVAGGCAVACLALSCLPLPAAAEIKTRVAANGTIEIYNDGVGGAPYRPQTLRPVPQPTWDAWIRDHSAQHGIDPRLVQAVMQAESAYNPGAVSSKGALGLMQLMPATARQLSVAEPLSPEQNIRGGVAYLRQMLDRFGTAELAVAAYNAGPGAVERYRGVPPYAETRAYVRRVLALYRGAGGHVLVGLAGGGGPSRPNGLVQDRVPSVLQRALSAGTLAAAAAPAAAPAATVATAAPAAAAASAEAQQGAPAPAARAPRLPAPQAPVAAAAAGAVAAPAAVFAGGG